MARRERGGSVGDLVADLPRILSVESGRSTITTTRGAPAADPPDDRAALARRSRAARGRHDAREAAGARRSTSSTPTLAALRSFERELSDLRAQLHVVIDAIDRVIADRRVAGSDGMRSESLESLETRLHDLGDFIRDQRRNARLSLRKLSELAGISNPYLSQIERGLRKPSAEILQGIARGLRISAETLYVRAGILDEQGEPPDLVAAVLRDPTL